jgi:uncharacterized protein (UPF0216 family)
MQKQILEELKEIKTAIATLAGTSHLPPKEQLSVAVLDKVAIEFKKLSKQSDEWLSEHDLYKYFKDSRYGTGKFIREEFKFSNYFKHGKSHYYNRTDIQALAKELKERNVKLPRYMELKEEENNLKKRIASALLNKRASKGKKAYHLTDDVQDINISDYPKPSTELIKEDLKNIQEEFFKYKMEDYIDIYRGNYAMVKYDYNLKKYISNEIKQRCKKWCENFNYANNALELLTQKKNNFIPVKEDDMIQL